MTTVSVMECLSPISLRTCGSSVSSLAYNRTKLHSTSQTKRLTAFKFSSQDLRDAYSPFQAQDVVQDLGLEKALTSTPLQSPVPRATPSTLGCVSRNTLRRTPSVSTIESSDEELNDEIWRPCSPDSPDNLFIVGSKPRLHGMWQVPDIGSVTPLTVRQATYPTRNDCFDNYYDNERISGVSPENPPPSPVNFRAGMTGVVVGGHKLSYPERTINTPENSRDFNPGFVKKPLHHCLKCEGRIKEEELTQVTLHRRLSSILNNHMVENLRREEALLKSHSMRDFRRGTESRDCHHASHFPSESPDVLTSREDSRIDMYSKASFSEMFVMKRRKNEEREKEMRERRLKEKRLEEIKRLKEKISRKYERSSKALFEYRAKQSRTRLHTKHSRDVMSSVEGEVEELEAIMISDHHDDTHLPPICIGQRPSMSPEVTDKEQPSDIPKETQPDDKLQHNETIFPDDKSLDKEEKRVNKMAKYVIKKSWSDVFPCRNRTSIQSRNGLNPTETDKHSLRKTDPIANAVIAGLPIPTVALWKRYNDNNAETNDQDQPSISSSIIDMHDVRSAKTLEPVTSMPSTTDRNNADIQEEITMSATVIVPQRDTHCSQWITFNGDNEPVVNYGPDKEDGCETFLQRLQKAKLCNQNDPTLPSGQQFCFEAMVDKRYNRWKRRRRKKQSEARRVSVVQSSESSDENDDRNSAMERIIDKMYEQIHGPVPRTPNGSRETPRVRNRRRRKETTENTEQEPTLRYYDASSEWTSDGCLLSSSSVCNVNKQEMTRGEGRALNSGQADEGRPLNIGQSDEGMALNSGQSDDLCSWPYLEQYKTEILKRLQNTPPEQFKQLEKNDWLPEIDNHIQDKPETEIESNTQDRSETEIHNNILDKPETEVIFNLDANEDTIFSDDRLDTEADTEEFEPFIRVDEAPRQSPVSPRKTPLGQSSFPDLQYSVDPESQSYSYKKWSRSQRTPPSEVGTPEPKSRLLSRMSVSTWSDVGSETADCVSVVSIGDRQRKASSLKPVKSQDVAHALRDERRGSRKNQKVTMPIKKQNVNLPSLTKNSRSQTVPYTGSKHSENRLIKTLKSTQRFQTNPADDPRRSRNVPTQSNHKGSQGTTKDSQTIPDFKGSRATMKEAQTMPDFLFREYYLRSLYGNKVRMNSHIDSNHKNTKLRKTITVDNIELKAKKVKKKEAEDTKPSDASFTRSFTFSMFDLPNMYKVYNDNLERQANGEDVEAYE